MTQFWADDVDFDLLKILPDIEKKIDRFANAEVWTVGHADKRYNNLNHPHTWNSHGAFIWLEKPNLKKDDHGWFNVHGCVGRGQEIKCTFLEFLRDQWAHHFNAVCLPHGVNFYGFPWHSFEKILWKIRGWGDKEINADYELKAAEHWVLGAAATLSGLIIEVKS